MQKLAAGRLKHNFLITLWSPRRYLGWENDEVWDRIIHNIGIMAWMAKQGKCAGLFFDVEDYNLKRQFYHRPQEGSYEKSAALARKRGAQVMNAIAREYPEIVIMTTMLFCESNMLHHGKDVHANIKLRGDLWVPFVNGMLDVIPPTAKLVEGNEHSYWMNASGNDYVRSYWDMKSSFLRMASPENRDKYRNQVSSAFAFYPDAFTRPLGRKEITAQQALERFRFNFGEALRYTDEYIWFWGENHRYLDNWDKEAEKAVSSHSHIKKTTWDQEIPGFYRVMELVRCKGQIGEQKLKTGKTVNLMRNPDCVKNPKSDTAENPGEKQTDWKQGTLPVGWSFWPEKELSRAQLDLSCGLDDTSSLHVKGVKNGCFITVIPVKSGHFYGVEGFAKGSGKYYMKVRWQKEKGWFNEWAGAFDEILHYSNQGERNGWQRAYGAFQAPFGAARMVILLNVIQEPEDATWFDKLNVFEIQ